MSYVAHSYPSILKNFWIWIQISEKKGSNGNRSYCSMSSYRLWKFKFWLWNYYSKLSVRSFYRFWKIFGSSYLNPNFKEKDKRYLPRLFIFKELLENSWIFGSSRGIEEKNFREKAIEREWKLSQTSYGSWRIFESSRAESEFRREERWKRIEIIAKNAAGLYN